MNNPTITVKANDLKALKTIVSKDESYPALTAVCVSENNGNAVLQATDSYRMVKVEITTDNSAEYFNAGEQFLLPSSIFDVKTAKTDTIKLEISRNEMNVVMTVYDKKYTRKSETILHLLDVRYPKTQDLLNQVKETSPTKQITLNASFLSDIMSVFKSIYDKDAKPTLLFNGSMKPCFFTQQSERVNVTALLMPIRL